MSFNLRNYVANINDVPSNWIFSYYLKLPDLKGQSVKIKSIYNEKDSNPSLIIYYNRKLNKYTYKDFSSGNVGSAVDFMKQMWKCSFTEASRRIIEDFKNRGDTSIDEIDNDIKVQGWKVTSFKISKWSRYDTDYWDQYHISTDMLEHHKICPLKFYTMSLISDGEIVEEFTVKGNNIYGFFYGTEEGNLAKIYQPLSKDKKKFIKVADYIQGSDQNTGEPYLIIMSSLKDILALKTIGIKADFIAADSENTILSKSVINKLKKKYKKGNYMVIFDNDIAGINAMKKYKELYDIPFCYIPFEKDVAEILKTHGIDETMRKIVPLINKKLNNE